MKTFYMVRLTPVDMKREYYRFSLYYIDDEGDMTVVWGKRESDKIGSALPHQVYAALDQKYPAYHFKVGSCGMKREDCLAFDLAGYYKEDVTIHELHGYTPSSYVGRYRA